MIKPLFILLVVILCFNSCQTPPENQIKEGMIEYDIIYLNEDHETLYSFLLPKKMFIKFKKNRIKSELKGFSGNLYFSLISNTSSDSAIALFKIMNQNYYYVENEKGPSELFGTIPGMKLNFTKEKCIFAGVEAETVKVESNDEKYSTFDVIYTKQLKIDNPNKKNPFNDIDGVLLDFSVNLYNMDMRFVASRVVDTIISDSEFVVPEIFQRIDKANLNQILSLLK